ncbi:alpha/beta hydrolase [Tahibacter amnicola]|uniref:Alpha/beta hydrolase-fold protein n=1 Tax=Tahibacter amnicola TaxID=2976241 RepID=A0ABY6BI90_9GAMM|nr:alpha/beta hydrolase-fold protein [Tahibacter amnicola]UXI68810.1 alpha/beta hydrolase-fold protein [Tahibacter amnicola]
MRAGPSTATRAFRAFALAAALSQCVPALAGSVSLPRTERWPLQAAPNKHDYVIDVALPRSYAEKGNARRYPVIVTLDAGYAFAITRNVVEHLSDRDNLPEAIVVSVGYPGGIEDYPAYRRTRTRDYTPLHWPDGGYGPPFQKHSGGGPAFRDFLLDTVKPALARRYRVEPDDWTLVGHSYGGLFGAWLLTTRPAAFQRWLIVSPSLWYADRWLFQAEARANAERDDLSARVFLTVGANEDAQMAADLHAFSRQLCAHRWPSFALYSHVFEDENHNTVFPAALTRGLRVLFDEQPHRDSCERTAVRP